MLSLAPPLLTAQPLCLLVGRLRRPHIPPAVAFAPRSRADIDCVLLPTTTTMAAAVARPRPLHASPAAASSSGRVSPLSPLMRSAARQGRRRAATLVVRADHFRLNSAAAAHSGGGGPRSIRALPTAPTTSYAPAPAAEERSLLVPLVAAGVAVAGVAAILYRKLSSKGCAGLPCVFWERHRVDASAFSRVNASCTTLA